MATWPPIQGATPWHAVAQAHSHGRRPGTDSELQHIRLVEGATLRENLASLRLRQLRGYRAIGERERIAKLRGIWRDTILTERRSRLF
jgi:hypothetical protein